MSTDSASAHPVSPDKNRDDGAGATIGGRAAWYALTLVGLTQALSMVDRQVLAILMPRIKADLNIGDAEMGLLYGTVFSLFYALFSLPLGRLADGWIRTKLLGICIFGWSLMTAGAGFATSFATLAISRIGVGIGEASVQPAGMSLLSDSFPKHQRGTITAVIAAAVALGLGSALWIGGVVADWWDTSYAQGGAPLDLKGWQAAFIAAALPGFILSALLWFMREPVRGAADGITHKPDPKPFAASWATLGAILPGFAWLSFARQKAPKSAWMINIAATVLLVLGGAGLIHWTDSLRAANPIALDLGFVQLTGNQIQWTVTALGIYALISWLQSLQLRDRPAFAVMAQCPSVWLLVAIAAIQSAINYGVMAWGATFVIKTFHQSASEVGLKFGLMTAAIGIVGPLIAGPVADWANKHFPSGRLYVTLASFVVSPPLALMTFQAQSLPVFYAYFALYGLVLTMWLPSIYASFLDLVLPRMRGIIMSFYLLTMTIIGQGIGPYAVGLMSDRQGGDLRAALSQLYWLSPIALILVIVLIKQLPKDLGRVTNRARVAGEDL